MDPKVLLKIFMYKQFIVMGFLLVITQAVFAQAAGQWRDPQHMFDTVCALCHRIGVGPNLLGRELPVAYIETVVRHGRGPMPAFLPTEFSAKDLSALATLIHQSSMPSVKVAPVAEAGK